MINFKKGNGLTLQQADKVGPVVSGEGVVAGMVVRVHTDGTIKKGVSGTPLSDLIGFAINSQDDTDVTASGKLGVFLLANNAVLETDQAASTINSTNYPIGKRLKATTGGLLDAAVDGDFVVGHVEGIRSLPVVKTVNQDLSAGGDGLGNAHKIQTFTNLLGVKLEGYLWKTA